MGGIYLGNALLTHSTVENIIQDNDFYIKADGNHINWANEEVYILNISEPTNFTLNDMLVAKQEYRDIILQIDNLDTNGVKITNYLVLESFNTSSLINQFVNDNFIATINNNATITIQQNIKMTSVTETNKGLEQKFWRGTKEEYEALDVKDENTMYIVIDEEGNGVQPDWNQTDESAPDYIKNRTHWFENATNESILSEQNFTIVDNQYTSIPTGLNFSIGNSYTVIFDGVEYECNPYELYGAIVIGNSTFEGGNQNPDLPFLIVGGHNLIYANNGTHIISIIDTTEKIHYIDPKYIKDMYYEIPIIIEEKTSVGITDSFRWVKVADEINFDIFSIETISFSNSLGQKYYKIPVQVVEEEAFILLTDGYETNYGLYITPEQAEINEYHDAGLYLRGSETEGEEVEITYSFTCKSIVYKIDKKYLPNSNIINGSEEGSLEMYSDWEWNVASGKCSMAIGERSRALAEASFASGYESRINEEAKYGHAEGWSTEVSGAKAHAEGYSTKAVGEASHAEGISSKAIGDYSHAEGWFSEAHGEASHSENDSRAFGDYSHSEGSNTFAGGEASHAEGKAVILSSFQGYIDGEANALNYITNKKNNPNIVPGETVATLYYNNGHTAHASAIVETYDKTTGALTLNRTLSENEAVDGSVKFQLRGAAFGDYSHIEGYGTQALGQGAHAEGIVADDLVGSVAKGDGSHIEGVGTETGFDGYGAHAEGFLSEANGQASHAEGTNTTAGGESSHAEGDKTTASGNYSHSEGARTIASGEGSHAEGAYVEGYGASQATGFGAHAEGVATIASGSSSHAEGGCHLEYVDENGDVIHTTAAGFCSHAEGVSTQALGDWGAHAEGSGTIASGDSSHAEGGSDATGNWSHAEGNGSVSSGYAAHAEGYGTTASGDYSHSEGRDTIANGEHQHVQGRHNIEDSTLAHIVGNGIYNGRSNAHTLDWNGNAWFSGDVYVGSTSGTNKDEGSLKLATVADIEAAIGAAIGGSY